MIVMSHRGYWLDPSEKNTEVAFRRSFDLGFGTETDIRDCGSRLVISHDMPRGGEMLLSEFLDLFGERDLPLALNIKADGLGAEVEKTLEGRNLTQWFLFDMSIPDMVQCVRRGLPVFGRLSEIETQLALSDQVRGVWLDSFYGEWWNCQLIEDLTTKGKKVCIVSPDLHKRDPLPIWEQLQAYPFSHPNDVLLCTDFPEKAQVLFGGVQ